MRSVFNFVVKPKGSRKTNVKKVGDKDLILNTDLQDHKYVNRIGVVIGLPQDDTSGINVGDEVIVHHNVFRRFYDVRGKEKNSSSYFSEDVYMCSPDQVYMYKRDGEWKPLEGFCFVKPIRSLNPWTPNEEQPLMGFLKHADSKLVGMGIVKNDLVGFTPRSEYEFILGDQRLYRVYSDDISIKYECTGHEEEYNPSWT